MNKSIRKGIILSISLVLTILFMCATFYFPQERLTIDTSESSADSADADENLIAFILPVLTIPDNQPESGIILIQVKNNIIQIIQPMSKWFYALLFFCLLLSGCIVSWEYLWNSFTCLITNKVPEISFRIGGHAPPYYAEI